MAIYHFTAQTGTRKGGQSARAKFAYMNRLDDYEKQGDRLLFSQSSNMPSWAASDPKAYWDAADQHERSNGRLFKHIEASLPRELTLEQNIALVRRFVAELTGSENLPVYRALLFDAAAHRIGRRPPSESPLGFSKRNR